VYDMYPWSSASPGRRIPQPAGTSRGRGDSPSPRTTPLARAVQVALDRRDNGGDAAATVDTASKTLAGPARQ
jgi:hypothetical protein